MSEEAIVQDYGKRLREALLLTLTLTLTLTLALTLTLTLTLTLALTLTLTLALTLTLTNPNQVLPPVQREALRTPRPRLRLVTRLVRRHALATATERGGGAPSHRGRCLSWSRLNDCVPVRKQSPVFGALVKSRVSYFIRTLRWRVGGIIYI